MLYQLINLINWLKFWTIQLINQDFKTQLIDTFLPQLFAPLWSCRLETPGLFVQKEIKGGGNCKLAFHKACQASTKNHPEPSEMRYFEVTGDLPPMLNQLHLPYAYALFYHEIQTFQTFQPIAACNFKHSSYQCWGGKAVQCCWMLCNQAQNTASGWYGWYPLFFKVLFS